MKDILIVEDGKQDRERLEKLFTDAGYQVQACASVTAAEKILENEKFRLAILDVGLADRSGSLLFNSIKRHSKDTLIIIFTGNPSVHLKQRFMAEGAVAYVVKASADAQNDSFLLRVKDLLGKRSVSISKGYELSEFLDRVVASASRKMFLDMDDRFPACKDCGNREYLVCFDKRPQIPPEIIGSVVCSNCGKLMDPEVE